MRLDILKRQKKWEKAIWIGSFVIVIIIVCYIGGMGIARSYVKKQVEKEIVAAGNEPEYGDEYTKANAIRDYVYANTPFAQSADLVIDQIYPARHIYAKELGTYYTMDYYRKILDLDRNLRGGYYCGGMAEVLAELYGVLGFNSCVLGVSLKNEESIIVDGHAVVLVLIDDSWIIEDPTFNICIENEDNECVGISELRENLGKEVFHLSRGNTLLRKYISADGRYTGVYDVYGEGVKYQDFYYYEIDTDVNRYKEENYEIWKAVMGKDGYDIAYESIFMYPSMIYIPKSQRYNKNYIAELYSNLSRELGIENIVDFTTY